MTSRLHKLRNLLPINRSYTAALVSSYGLMGITIALQLMLIPLYLEHLGKKIFGVLAILMAANNYAAIGVGWLSGSMNRILAERAAIGDRQGFSSAYSFSKWIYISYALLVIGLFWLVSPWLIPDALKDPEIRLAIILSCVYLFIVYEYNTDRQAFMARHWQARGNIREAAGQIVFGILALLGLYANLGLPGIIVAQIIGVLFVRGLVWCHWHSDDYKLGWKLHIDGARDLWMHVSGKEGRDFVVYGILLLTFQADTLILGWLAGAEVAGNYYLLWRIPEVCLLLLSRISASYSPHFIAMDSRGKGKELNINYKRGLKIMMILSAFAAVVYGFFGQWIVSLWIGDSTSSRFIPYLFAASALFFIAISRWPIDFAYALLNTRSLVRITAIETVSKLLITCILLRYIGFYAPVVAVTIIHLFGLSFAYRQLGVETLNRGT